MTGPGAATRLRQTDRQHRHSLEKINKVHIHLTVKTCSPTGKGGQEGGGAVSMLQRGAVGIGGRKWVEEGQTPFVN